MYSCWPMHSSSLFIFSWESARRSRDRSTHGFASRTGRRRGLAHSERWELMLVRRISGTSLRKRMTRNAVVILLVELWWRES
jgi:hypothetical protein